MLVASESIAGRLATNNFIPSCGIPHRSKPYASKVAGPRYEHSAVRQLTKCTLARIQSVSLVTLQQRSEYAKKKDKKHLPEPIIIMSLPLNLATAAVSAVRACTCQPTTSSNTHVQDPTYNELRAHIRRPHYFMYETKPTSKYVRSIGL
jgi:hypothetical protein